jgi:putative RecB family exonuclease
MFFASPTKLATWRQCRRRYRYRYIDHLPAKPRPWLSFGQSLHATLKDLFDTRPENRKWAGAERSYRRNWVRKGYAGAEEERSYFERGIAALQRIFASDDISSPRPRAVEFNVQAKIDDVVLCGKVDRVDDSLDGMVITDYKTGRPRAPERAQADQAFTMYALLVQARFKQAPARLVWDFVETGDKVTTARAPEALSRAQTDVLALVAQVRADDEYPASPGPLCGLCDYLERCPEGQAARREDFPEPPAELVLSSGED